MKTPRWLADSRLAAALAVVTALATGVLVRPGRTAALDVGGSAGGFLGEGWSVSNRTDLDAEVALLDSESAALAKRFRFRAAHHGAQLRLPVVPRGGPLTLRLRAMARVRTAVGVHVAGQPAARLMLPRGRWGLHEVEIPAALVGDGLDATLGLEAMPMVRVPDEYAARPRILVADVVASAPGGLAFATPVRVELALVPLVFFAFGLAVGLGPPLSLLSGLVAAGLTLGLASAAPLPLLAAIPRLVGPALAAGLLARVLLGRATDVTRAARAALPLLLVAGTLLHGALAFVPGFDPHDVEVHVRRARDLGGVPFEYDAILRYGSHLPTETQTFGTATTALGERALIPYSPLPYVAYYALHGLGIDLGWGIMVLNVLLCMAVVPWLWLAARRVWGAGAAWVAAVLLTLDLPLWHHTARSHAPSVFGAALTTAALLYFAREAAALGGAGRVAKAAGLLALAALGYSSQAVLLGLFGVVLLALLVLDARGLAAPARLGHAAALVLGGLLAGALFYFHFVPGLLQAAGPLQTDPDLYPGRTYLVFHNESRQSMRIWAAGFLLPLGAGLLAFPLALRRALPSARPVLAAWLGAWALVMLLKEPVFFPRPLRWAKEEQFVSPLLALLIGAAVTALPQPWQRRTAGTVVVVTALWLQLGDFRTHLLDLLP